MHTIGTIIIGLFVGLVARFIKPGNDPMGIIMTTLIGIGGAFIGRFLGEALGIYSSNQPAGFVGSVLGAVVILAFLKTANSHKELPH